MTAKQDQVRWNTRYASRVPVFAVAPLIDELLTAGPPAGPVLEIACGPSGSALELARQGRLVVAVDISNVALEQLAHEASRRGVGDAIELVEADAAEFQPAQEHFAIAFANLFWDAAAFRNACAALAPGGLLGWQALAATPDAPSPWRVPHGQLSAELPGGFDVISEAEGCTDHHAWTRLIARRVKR